jgi:hypothetical protein
LVDPFLALDYVLPFFISGALACLLRLVFGWAASESAGVASGERALLADAFLVDVEEDLIPID